MSIQQQITAYWDDRAPAYDEAQHRPGRDGEADLAHVAGVPATVVIDWLGLDPSEYSNYVDAMHTLVAAAPGSPEYVHAAEVAVPWVSKTVREHIAHRREHPSDDATTHFINVEVDDSIVDDPQLAAKLTEVCPVDIYADAGGRVDIVEENLDECVLCNLCVDAAPEGTVRIVKLYE